jgi:Zn-dependent metalloprotease
MYCNFVPDDILKFIKDDHTLKLSKKLRDDRNKFRRLIKGLFKKEVLNSEFKSIKHITYTCNNTTNLPGEALITEGTRTGGPSSNKSANEAHELGEVTDNFYLTLFDRNSYDDKGSDSIASVNYDKDYNNAFWNGSQMVYGDGDGKFFKDLAGDLTVDAHEKTHGHTQFICGLNYISQSGALNEALSDIFGLTCSHWHYNQNDPKTASWLIGDKCLGTEFPGKALRSFIPYDKAYKGDKQPSHKKEYVWTFSDNFGVHTNSKIINVIFYRICQNLNEASYLRPIQVVYKTWFKLKASSNFKDFCKKLIQSAEEMKDDALVAAVRKAVKDTGY